MLPYLVCRIANYTILLFIAMSLAYLLASTSLDPSTLWNRQDLFLSWDAIHASLVKYSISHDLPVWDRCVTWLRNVPFCRGQGCVPKGELISTLIGIKTFVSMRPVFLGVTIGMVEGVALGARTATRQYRFSDHVISLISIVITPTPAMVITILLQVLAVQINHGSGFQVSGFIGEGKGALGRFQYLLLPTLSMSLGGIASYSRLQHNLMPDIPGADYVRTVRAKGLIKCKALTRHVLHTAPVSIATYFIFALVTLFTGAVITERVYGQHGMDEYFISVTSGMDINGVIAVVAFSRLCALTGALLSDIFVTIVDPRMRVN